MGISADTNLLRFIAPAVDLVGGSTATIIPATARKWRTTRIDIQVKSVSGFVTVAPVSIGSNSAQFQQHHGDCSSWNSVSG